MGVDDKAFWEMFRQKRDANDPQLQYEIGRLYYWGRGGTKIDYRKALVWFAIAAQQGYADAQNRVGHSYEFGKGVEKNISMAHYWYKLAADQKNAPAINSLARFYEQNGNFQEALGFYAASAQQGYWPAFENAGVLYHVGTFNGVKDLKMAEICYRGALNHKDYPRYRAEQADIDRITARLNEVSKEIEAEKEAKALAARIAARQNVFVSYSHKDAEFLDVLAPQLNLLTKTTEITWWSDRGIKGGNIAKAEIEENMRKAKVAVLIISANFFNSEYIWTKELPALLEAAEKEGATILCLLARNCPFQKTEIGKRDYQFVKPAGGELIPLAKMDPAQRDDIYVLLVNRIEELFEK